jgi:tetratricopeptide (TPR) repeat protein
MNSNTTAPASPTPAPAGSAGAIQELRALVQHRRFAEALEAGEALLRQTPDQRDALLSMAVSQRYLGRTHDALATLVTLEHHHPGFSRLYEERGRCHVDLKQASPAIDAFVTAVTLNHALIGCWRMLESLLRLSAQTERADVAASRVASLSQLPAEVLACVALFADGDLDGAETRVRAYLLAHGDHVEAMRLLASIGIARGIFDDPEILLAAVLERAPHYRAARREYAGVLLELYRYAQALAQIEPMLAEQPEHRELRLQLAACRVGLGDHERAIELYRTLLRETPEDPDLHLSIGHAEKTLGSRERAIDSYRRAAACRTDFGDAYWSLANLKTYRFTDEELGRVRAALDAPATGTVDRYHLCFALGKALEDKAEYAESFAYYERGNREKRAESRYRPELIENNTRGQIEVCTAEFFARRRGWGSPSPEPIFIVGLPRSGSTLLEQILASHSQVEGTQELANIQQIANNLRGREPNPSDPRYPRILNELTAEECAALGERYLADTRIYRTGRAFFIDKMPNNFRHLGLIHLMLPNARIIDARREPMACCFGNLKQLFARGQEFTYSVEDIARYYRTYLELMRHWDAALPGRVLRLQHEDVVEDLDGSVRRLLEFCELGFEPQCLDFHTTARSVRTASSEQVRMPLYREGLDQWKHFEPWLQPLKGALGDALERYRD